MVKLTFVFLMEQSGNFGLQNSTATSPDPRELRAIGSPIVRPIARDERDTIECDTPLCAR